MDDGSEWIKSTSQFSRHLPTRRRSAPVFEWDQWRTATWMTTGEHAEVLRPMTASEAMSSFVSILFLIKKESQVFQVTF